MRPPTLAFVCFGGPSGGRYAVPVAAAGAVLPFGTLDPLPEPLPGVLGLLRHHDRTLPVLAPFGGGGRHVLLLTVNATRFGLLVEEVTGVVRVSEDDLHPPPPGQARALVVAVAQGTAGGALVLDPEALAERLRGRIAPGQVDG